jgi:hypothetical protein
VSPTKKGRFRGFLRGAIDNKPDGRYDNDFFFVELSQILAVEEPQRLLLARFAQPQLQTAPNTAPGRCTLNAHTLLRLQQTFTFSPSTESPRYHQRRKISLLKKASQGGK